MIRLLSWRWRMPFGVSATVFAVLSAQPTTAQGQDTLLERWSVGYVTDGWSPRWGGAAQSDPAEAWTTEVRAATELLSLRSAFRLTESTVDVAARRSFAPVSFGVAASSGAWSTEAGDRRLLTVARSEAVAAGVDVIHEAAGLGRLAASTWAGWDSGPGGTVALSSRSAHHALTVDGWRSHARDPRVTFPADSLRDVGTGHAVWGGRARAEVGVTMGGVLLRPRVEWRRDVFDADSMPSGAFLDTELSGDQTLLDYGLEIGADGAGARFGYRTRDVTMESAIVRSGQSAGNLPTAFLDFTTWSARVWTDVAARTWSASLGADELRGRMSTRVETWPFVDLWGTLSAQAYRLTGAVDASAAWARLGTAGHGVDGWAWTVDVSRFELRVDRDSWYVTSFGFGRRDRVTTVSGSDPAWMIGGSGRRSIASRGGRLELTGAFGVPVASTPLVQDDAVEEGGLAGYLRLTVAWVR